MIIILIVVVVVVGLVLYGSITTCRKYKGTSSMDDRERGSHARGEPTQHRIARAHGNSKGEARGRSRHKSNNNRVVCNMDK